MDSNVPNDSPVRHRTSKVSRIRHISCVCLCRPPSHLRCRDFRSDVLCGADGTNAFVSSSLNPHSISASHTTMVPRPARPVTPEEVENRRKRNTELKRLERETRRKRRRPLDQHDEESREHESRRHRCEQLRQQKATYERNWVQTRQEACSRTPSPETLSAIVSPGTLFSSSSVVSHPPLLPITIRKPTRALPS